jgi:integrase/recombinase XerD
MLLDEAIDALITATRANGRSAGTVKAYREMLGYLLDFLGNVPVESITVQDLRRYVSHLMDQDTLYEHHPKCEPQAGKLSPFTIAGRERAVKRLFNWLVEEEILTDSPARRIKVLKPKRLTQKAISHNDLVALLRTTEGDALLDSRDRGVILFLADTGCRVGGLCGVTLPDVDLEKRLVTVTEKGEKTRVLPFSPITAEALRAWLAVRPATSTTALFLSLGILGTRLTPMTTRGVSQMLARRAQRAGIEGPVNPHSFRHGFARDFLMDGGDLGTLADLMGHSTVLVTKEFYGVFIVQELQQKHAQHSPIMQLFGREENTNGSNGKL